MRKNRHASRLGDRSHPSMTPAATGSSNVLLNNKPLVREHDLGAGAWIAVEGAARVLVNGRRLHRISDKHSSSESCEGSPNCLVGDADHRSATATPVTIVEVVEEYEHAGNVHTRPMQDRMQYINLDPSFDTTAPHPEFGRSFRVKARVEPPSKGQAIYWYLEPAASNRPSLPRKHREGVRSPGSEIRRATTVVRQDGWTDTLTVHLSLYGGDEYSLYMSTSEDAPKATKVVSMSVWRKLYCDVIEMQKPSGGTFSLAAPDIQAAQVILRDCFLELEDTTERATGPHVDNFSKWSDAKHWVQPLLSSQRSPHKVSLCAIDHFSDPEQVEDYFIARTTPFIRSLTSYDFDGKKWFLGAEYFVPDPTPPPDFVGPPGGTLVPLDATKITISGASGARTVSVDLSGLPAAPSASNPMQVKFTYLSASSTLGIAVKRSRHLFVCCGWGYSSHTLFGNVIAHEIGHVLGLVDRQSAWHTTAKKHEGHCDHKDCVMWYASGSTPTYFHPEKTSDPGCRTEIRGRHLDRKSWGLT